MRLALLADIHSNYAALKACLDFLESQDIYGIAFLGDYVSDCPYPQKTMELIYECQKKFTCWFIRGNREEYFLDYDKHKTGWKDSSNSGSLLYTYENLTERDIRFFSGLPIYQQIQLDGYPPFSICHGSPANSREDLLPNTDVSKRYLNELTANYLFCAHTHQYFRYSFHGKMLINCASVGAPVNGQVKAQMVIISFVDGQWKDELISVSYDIEKIISDFDNSRLSEKAFIWAKSMIKLLRTGRNYNFECICLAIQKAHQIDPDISAYDIPEKFWEAAAKELSII